MNTVTNATVPQASDAGVVRKNLNPLMFLEDLHQRQIEWNDKHYKSTTDKLYALLADCLQACNQLSAADLDTRKRFFMLCEEKCQIERNKKMQLTARVVSYVFRITGPRALAYSRVLTIAIAEKVSPDALAKWIADRGGIEAVRRTTKNGKVLSDKEKADAAIKVLEITDALLVIDDLPAALHSDASNSHDFSLALIRHDRATNRGYVVRGSANGTLVQQFLVSTASQVMAESANREVADKHQAAMTQDVVAVTRAVLAAMQGQQLAA